MGNDSTTGQLPMISNLLKALKQFRTPSTSADVKGYAWKLSIILVFVVLLIIGWTIFVLSGYGVALVLQLIFYWGKRSITDMLKTAMLSWVFVIAFILELIVKSFRRTTSVVPKTHDSIKK